MKMRVILFILFLPLVMEITDLSAQNNKERPCIECHKKVTPNIVDLFASGKMGKIGLDCSACHGKGHVKGNEDVGLVEFPTLNTCKTCHPAQTEQYINSKHALAWEAMKAMPLFDNQLEVIIGQGQTGCSMCHKIGLATDAERTEDSYRDCTSCHSMHAFSKDEASHPRICQSCHTGLHHNQWEMWSNSRHGVLWQIYSGKTNRAPTCQTCHMPEGNHRVMTAWGFLAIRIPEKDKTWLDDRNTILQALGLMDDKGSFTERFQLIQKVKMARLNKEDFDRQRQRMLEVCSQCHNASFSEDTLKSSEQVIRQADKLMAEAIKVVQALYKDKILKRPKSLKSAPDILHFYEAKTPVELTLYKMFFDYRMHTIQGSFHLNANVMQWLGWAPMKEALNWIKNEAIRLRAEQRLRL